MADGRRGRRRLLPFRFLDNVAIADVAFEARGRTLPALFESCARALTEVMVDRRSVRPRRVERITLTSDSTENLLYDFLTDLIIRKDVDSILFKDFRVSLDKSGRRLECVARGEMIDRKRHRLRNDVKAVTTHLFGIKRSGKGFSATVVLDI
ncbi:MAG: archease [Thaumarchaeota archaeon]|nr:MAG: archease [Nitrososphaerota archaeon]